MYDILTLGTAGVDFFIFKKDFQPEKLEANFKNNLDGAQFFCGGGALNTAFGFKKLNLKVATYIQVGKDFLGDFIKKELNHQRIKFYVDHSSKPTAFSFILRTKNKDDFLFVWRGASSLFEFKDVKKIKKIKAKNVYVGPNLSKLVVLKSLVSNLKKNGSFIIWNPSVFHLEQGIFQLKIILNYVDVLFLNKKEAEILTQKNLNQSIEILKSLPPQFIVITLEKKGAVLITKDLIYFAPTFPEREIVDRTGAGDAFVVGFIGALILKSNLKEALRWGSANATSVIEHLGASNGHLTKNDYNKLRWQKLTIKKFNFNDLPEF